MHAVTQYQNCDNARARASVATQKCCTGDVAALWRLSVLNMSLKIT